MTSQYPPWATSYINYIRLKQLIYPLFDLEYAADGSHAGSPLRDTSSSCKIDIKTSHEFQQELNNEIQKALLFLLQTMGKIAAELSELSEDFITLSANVQLQLNAGADLLQQIHAMRMQFIDRVGSKLLLLLEFIELNIEAITKIVKKHDKAVARWEASSAHHHYGDEQHRYQRLRTQYLPRFAVYSSNANVRCLYLIATDAGDINSKSTEHSTFGGWNAMQFNLEKTLKQLSIWEKDLQKRQNRSGMPDSTALIGADSLVNLSAFQTDDYPPLSRHRSLSFSFDLNLSNVGKRSQSTEAPFFEPMLYRIQSTRKRLGIATNRYNSMVYAHEMLGDTRDENNQSQMETRFGSMEKLTGDLDVGPPSPMVSQLSKFLNLASSALYMCNYNVTTPTSGLYAKLLGFDEAHAGLIIGMTPTAVIVSSVLYSWWSSYSYKRALIFASSCCAIGNLIYAFALPCNSLTMVLLGRLMTGFGSARTINRRYIADYYNIEERTAGMADFVSASALGMAVGPGLAAFLSLVAPEGKSHGDRWWTVETAPGYVMFVLWCIYLCSNILFFEEPDRMHQSFTKEEKAGTSDERTPLKSSHASISMDNMEEEDSCGYLHRLKRSLSVGSIPVFVCLLLLVLLKAVLEGLTSSTPTVSRFYFNWGVHACGTYLAILASLMIPANWVVANVSRKFDDREIILAMLVMMVVGIAGFMTGSEREPSFICFSLIIFISCNALEGPTMGLLSKVIPKSLRAGILNAGLLATEAGTIGRVVGDFWLTSAAHKGIDKLVHALFGPLILLVAASIVVSLWNYSRLQPRYDDVEDDD
jgi:hypothetical protein